MPSFLSASHSTRAGSSSSSSHRRSRSQRSFMSQSTRPSTHFDSDDDQDGIEGRRLVHPSDGVDEGRQGQPWQGAHEEGDHNEDFLCKPPARPGPDSFNPAAKALRKLSANSGGSRRGHIILSLLAGVVFCSLFANHIRIAWLRLNGIPPGLYSRAGRLVVGSNTPFHIKGVSWYGMEEETHLFGGLADNTIGSILDFAKSNRFNAIRVPLSVENIDKNPESRIRNVFSNIEVKDALYLDLLRHVIRKAAERDILILLDVHRIHNVEVQSKGLWYSDDHPESKLVQTWRKLCREFGDEWNVFGADLKNEPWNSTWNTGDIKTDWKRGSEVVGEALHTMCPAWTLFIEGVGTNAGAVKTNCFWSENLAAMQTSPPAMRIRKKVVLSPHVYGPSVFMQEYFKTPGFLERMPAIWEDHFGQASNITQLATVVGEWGGKFVGKDEDWQRRFFRYISDKGFGFFYWCLNPESSDTGGLLKADWKTPERKKLDMLRTAQSTSVEQHAIHFKYLRHWRA